MQKNNLRDGAFNVTIKEMKEKVSKIFFCWRKKVVLGKFS